MTIKTLAMVSNDEVVAPLYYYKECEMRNLMNQVYSCYFGTIMRNKTRFIFGESQKKGFLILKEISWTSEL